MNKETIIFLRHIDYARLRGFGLRILLSYEISATSFYLTKDGVMRKGNKSELTSGLKSKMTEKVPTTLPETNHPRVIIIDFMAFARKVPVKKKKLNSYNDLFDSLWNTFNTLATSCERIDIVFDVYVEHSVKASERRRRATVEGIETMISTFDQILPVEMERFWSLSANKTALQQLFIKWVLNKIKLSNFDKVLYLGGSHEENDAICLSYINGLVSKERLLQCYHEEADDRIFFHANHAVKVSEYKSVVIATDDTDIFVCATQHFSKLQTFDLEELWVVSGRANSRTFFPIHNLSKSLEPDLINVLIPLHALSGADCLSKVGTKSGALKAGEQNYELLSGFGQEELSEEMISNAEKFLLKCVTKHEVNTFDELRYVVYHEKYSQFDIERFPPTSDSIRLHISRGYLQCFKWLLCPFLENIPLDPLDHGYWIDEDGNMVPIISMKPPIPCNFPLPCTCQKCSRATCKCRVLQIACCQYCKCNASSECKNPVK